MAIQVVKYGTPVTTVIGNIKGLVTAVCIRDTNVTYEISYFNNGLSVNCWLYRIEFTIDESAKSKPGLVNYDGLGDNYLLLK